MHDGLEESTNDKMAKSMPRIVVQDNAMERVPTKKVHVPLHDDVHAQLRRASEETGRPTTEIAREAIQAWLDDYARARTFDAVRAFAEANSGGELDLVDAFEDAAAEALATQTT